MLQFHLPLSLQGFPVLVLLATLFLAAGLVLFRTTFTGFYGTEAGSSQLRQHHLLLYCHPEGLMIEALPWEVGGPKFSHLSCSGGTADFISHLPLP